MVIDTYIDLNTLGLAQGAAGNCYAAAASLEVVGTNTEFEINFKVGDLIRLGSGSTAEIRQIASISDDLNLTVTEAFARAHSKAPICRVAESDPWDMATVPAHGLTDYPFLSGSDSPRWLIYAPAAGALFIGR